jgi:acetylornithine deacetylase/succinyl-diaminopimelate desuccinylase-like protein
MFPAFTILAVTLVQADPVDRILATSLAEGKAYATLRELCQVAPHRLSGSEGAERAVRWAKEVMSRAGLESVRLEPCTVPKWERGKVASLVVVEPAESRSTWLPVVALGGSVATPPLGIEAGVLEVRSFEELAEKGETARGKIVFFDRPMDPKVLDPFEAYGGAVEQRGRGAIEAAKHGGVAAIVRSMSLAVDDAPHTGAMHYEDGTARVPSAAVSTAGAERLSALLRAQPDLRLRLRLDCAGRGEAPSSNVVGEIRGAKLPDEIVLVGAHLDGWDVGQGAHDDGSGCAQVLEAMRLLRALDLRPARTIRAILFMNEENGLRGARAYGEAHRDEAARHVLAIETDRGGFAPCGFSTDATGDALGALRAIAARLDAAGASSVRAGGGGADVSVLHQDGVPLMELLTEPSRYFDVHHSERDTLDAVHPRELELDAAVLAAMAFGAADAGPAISRPAR